MVSPLALQHSPPLNFRPPGLQPTHLLNFRLSTLTSSAMSTRPSSPWLPEEAAGCWTGRAATPRQPSSRSSPRTSASTQRPAPTITSCQCRREVAALPPGPLTTNSTDGFLWKEIIDLPGVKIKKKTLVENIVLFVSSSFCFCSSHRSFLLISGTSEIHGHLQVNHI